MPLSTKQMQFCALMANTDLGHDAVCKQLGIRKQTAYDWKKKLPEINERIELLNLEAQRKITPETISRKVRSPDPADVSVRDRALEDFNFFRREFLNIKGEPAKSTKAQKRWIEWFEAEERTVLLCPRNHGKSLTLVHYCVWLIVRDRSIRILLLSRSSGLAERWIRAIKAILEGKGKYSKLVATFGEFKPLKPEKWTQNELIVEGADPEEAHPTLSCFGVTAAIYGLRADYIFCDDIVDNENAGTEEQREKLKDVFFSAIENILDAAGGRKPKMGVIGTRKHPLDLYNDLLNTEGFNVHVENAVISWDGRGKVLSPELFDIAFFRDKKNKLGLKKFNREFQNAAFDERDVIVSGDAFDDGRNRDLGRSFGDILPRWYIIIGVDPGTSQKGKGTFSAIVEGFDPEEPGKRYLIDYFEGNMPSEDQPRFLCHWYVKYAASAMRVESNACQKYLMDSIMREAAVSGTYGGEIWGTFFPNVHPHFTNHTKLNDPIAGLDVVGTYFEKGLWSLPTATESDEARTQEFIDKIVGYTFREHRKAHLLMTLWFGENEILDRQTKTLSVIELDVPWWRAADERRWIDIRR
jgi:hypothetical protein